jgi:hypothetical protein
LLLFPSRSASFIAFGRDGAVGTQVIATAEKALFGRPSKGVI